MWSFGNSARRQLPSRGRPQATALWMMLACILTGTLGGCGGAPKPAAVAEVPQPVKRVAKPERRQVAENNERPAKKKEGEIPFDAFFDSPLEVADEKGVVAAVAKPDAGEMPDATATKPAAVDTPKAAAGGMAWIESLPLEDLQSEVKKIQNRLKGSLQGQGTYNGNYKDISVDGAVIAALAGIAIEHSGDVSWKKNAPIIRDLGYELSQASTGLGKDNYERSKAAYDKIDSVFGGAVPADAPKSVPKRPFNETAGREGLMKRIEKARNHLRDNINTEAKLKADTEGIVHETLLIAILGKIVATDGYTSADEQDYQQFAEALINGANDATAAAKDQSFQKFTDSMNKVNKSCDQCHANYGNG